MPQKINDTQYKYDPQKVLWEGIYYMSAAQTITLSEALDKQKNGIILAWSRYNGTTAFDDSWNYTVIPKTHLAYVGSGVVCPLYQGTGAAAQKYVYVGNTTIAGHAINNTAPNTAQVLRRVIGF